MIIAPIPIGPLPLSKAHWQQWTNRVPPCDQEPEEEEDLDDLADAEIDLVAIAAWLEAAGGGGGGGDSKYSSGSYKRDLIRHLQVSNWPRAACTCPAVTADCQQLVAGTQLP